MSLRAKPPVARPRFVAVVLWLGLANVAPAADPAAPAVVHLTDGGFVAGELRGSDDPKVLRWSSPFFARPLEFPLGAVKAVHYAAAAPSPPAGEFCFELVNDDVLYGDLLAVTDDDFELNSARAGRLHLRRDHVRRLYRWKGLDSVYLGPNGLAGWKDPAATPQWRDEGGQIVTDRPGATLFGDLGIPERAMIEVELSWKAKPDFVFALGVEDRDGADRHAFRLEVWDGDLVVVGESNRDADAALVQPVGSLGGQARVQVYLDQQQRRLIVLSRSGKTLATLTIGGGKPPVRGGVRLTNGKGDVRLQQLRVTRWNGLSPRDVRDDHARLHRTDGAIVYGQLAAFDPVSKQFTIRDGATDTPVSLEAVADVFLAPPPAAGRAPADPPLPQTLRVVYRDGSRFSGTLTRVEDGRLALTCPGVKEPLRLPLAEARSLIPLPLPLAEVRSLIPLPHGKGADAPPAAGRAGRLELEGVSLKGRLVSDDAQPDSGRLVWHPDLARNASPLPPGLSGRIVYREPPPAPSVRPVNRLPVPVGMVAGVIRSSRPAEPTPPRSPSGGRRSMHLRTGDTIPCEVTRIDEQGVTFKTPNSDATFVAHEKIKSVELVATRGAPSLDEAKRDRLLTLPRMQKDSPPTHLICSRNGDILRGRVVAMDDARLKVEVRLETREIPRDRVAQIIWLHADELTDPKATAGAAGGARQTRVQTVNADGNRLTFVLGKADGTTVSGTSDVLGACRVNLADVDQLLFGTSIEQSAAQLAYHRWRLHHAPEPKFAQADAGGSADGGSTGSESPLVGQPAPTFQLDLLDGSKYRLSERKGRVVVLEFWATWCGPCLQSMPLVEGVVREFADRDVELVAVNLEEQPGVVKSLLDRHKLKVPVALDRDGVVAAKYAVTAIPQTVVIDRDGKVVRLFVGGGKATADSLHKVLQTLSAK
jgi:thiol-disulfide isomerase/thioredoxin